MAGILKRKKRLGRPRKSVKDARPKKADTKSKTTKSKSTKAKSTKLTKSTKSTKSTETKAVKNKTSNEPKVDISEEETPKIEELINQLKIILRYQTHFFN